VYISKLKRFQKSSDKAIKTTSASKGTKKKSFPTTQSSTEKIKLTQTSKYIEVSLFVFLLHSVNDSNDPFRQLPLNQQVSATQLPRLQQS
jgi:hypothetical protein